MKQKPQRKGICLSCKYKDKCGRPADPLCKHYKMAYVTGTAKAPSTVLPCPFCGKLPTVTPYPGNTGASVQCNNKRCAAWHTTFDLVAWNRRAEINISGDTAKALIPLLYEIVPVYKSGDFYKTQEVYCRSCGSCAKEIKDIKHKEYCHVRKIRFATP